MVPGRRLHKCPENMLEPGTGCWGHIFNALFFKLFLNHLHFNSADVVAKSILVLRRRHENSSQPDTILSDGVPLVPRLERADRARFKKYCPFMVAKDKIITFLDWMLMEVFVTCCSMICGTKMKPGISPSSQNGIVIEFCKTICFNVTYSLELKWQ